MAKDTKKPTKLRARGRKRPDATHHAIAERAYELYASGAGGDALEHWLQAERELRAA
jgi:hypothetical protein